MMSVAISLNNIPNKLSTHFVSDILKNLPAFQIISEKPDIVLFLAEIRWVGFPLFSSK